MVKNNKKGDDRWEKKDGHGNHNCRALIIYPGFECPPPSLWVCASWKPSDRSDQTLQWPPTCWKLMETEPALVFRRIKVLEVINSGIRRRQETRGRGERPDKPQHDRQWIPSGWGSVWRNQQLLKETSRRRDSKVTSRRETVSPGSFFPEWRESEQGKSLCVYMHNGGGAVEHGTAAQLPLCLRLWG